ncbi:unnamed protein product [marine sediment metagenome]|uniref:HTH cro/C1-type domain-containing protein n=1 Tax=marine sediment metagenome TaxID=412755 RepID=X0XS77_9ZZZZ
MAGELSAPVDAKALGAFTNRLRVQLGMTTTTLSQRVGVCQPQISRLENGLRGFRSVTLAKIARALGFDVKVVFVPRR